MQMIQWPMLFMLLSLDHHGNKVKIVHTMLMIFLWLGTPLCKGTPGTELAEPAVPFLSLSIIFSKKEKRSKTDYSWVVLMATVTWGGAL